jgi:hypothetical protein
MAKKKKNGAVCSSPSGIRTVPLAEKVKGSYLKSDSRIATKLLNGYNRKENYKLLKCLSVENGQINCRTYLPGYAIQK